MPLTELPLACFFLGLHFLKALPGEHMGPSKEGSLTLSWRTWSNRGRTHTPRKPYPRTDFWLSRNRDASDPAPTYAACLLQGRLPGPTSGSAGTGMPVIQRRGARPAYSRGGFPFRGPRKALRDPPTEAHTRQGPPEASPLRPLRGPFPGSLCLPPTKAAADPRKFHLWDLLLAKSQKVSL